MAKKDLRNGKESGRWKPSQWRPARCALVRTHVLDGAYLLLSCDVGAYQAGAAMAEMKALIDSAISRDAVHAAGMKTIGE